MKKSSAKTALALNLRQNRHNMRHLLIYCLLFIAAGLQAQVFMRPFDNAAAMGMGGATIAMPGISAGLGNDAQLGLGNKLGIFAGSALPYSLKGWQTAHFQGIKSIGKAGGIGISVLHSATEVYAEQRFQLAYGRRLGEKFYFGGSADVLRNNAQEYGSNTYATFSLSVLAKALPQVWVGAKVQNPFQQKIGADVLPTVVRVGATWKPTDIFLIALETEKDLERAAMVKMGIEYHPTPIIAIRVGTRSGKTARMAFGAGFRLKNGISLDIGSEWHPTLGITPSAMIAWRN